MKRAIARGRMVPQSLSTDPRMGGLSLKAALLYPLIWINCDDQGRVSGNPNEIKYACCPNIDDIAKTDIPELLKELDEQELIKVYPTSNTKAIQMLDWWEEQRLQWAYPSRYPPSEGWIDHLRYHPTPKEIITENWPPPSQLAGELLPSKLPSALPNELPNELPSKPQSSPLTTPLKKEKEERKGNRRGRGRLPSALGSKPSPSSTTEQTEILRELTQCFKIEWGRVPAREPDKIIPRELGGRETAQLRDLAKELSARGGVPLGYIKEAFREAVGQKKFHVSYVRAILLDWLGVARAPPQ